MPDILLHRRWRKIETMMRLLSLALASAMLLAAADPAATPIWPNGAPGETPLDKPEADTTKPTDNMVAGRRVARIGNVSTPTIAIYRPEKAKDNGAAVVVFPGGGYSILASDLEGSEICEWLNSIGVTGVLLKYRVPARPGRPRGAAPLEDAQRAVGIVRSRAKELGLNPARIGVLGFSAGGHLAAYLSTNFEKRTYDPIDAADAVSCRPDFTILIYPAYLTVRQEGDKISPELTITANTPPTFLVQTEDDPVRVENSLFYYAALKNAKVPAEMHIYPSGGHGYGLRRTEKTVTTWPLRAEEWLRSLGMLGAPSK
jgi:acetyl esterase/lipase